MASVCLILISNSSQARYITGYPELLSFYGKEMTSSQQAGLKETIDEAEENALNDIFRSKLNTMAAKIQFMMRRSRESIPTRAFNIRNEYLAIGFEKTLFNQGTWEKTAYVLLFETDEDKTLNYLDTYLFWRGANGIKEYQKISKGDICKQFSVLTNIADCEKDLPASVAKAEPVKPPPIPAPKTTSTPASKATVTAKPDQETINKIKSLESELDQLKAGLNNKAAKRHTHSGRDIKSGIIKEVFIDPAIPREREPDYEPTQRTLTDVDDAYVKRLEKRVVELESTLFELTSLFRGVYRNGNNLIFSGVNLQVVNGTGTTDGAGNSVGNLIVGYNEPRDKAKDNVRTGSHNVIVGSNNNYTSHGGIVAGLYNTISGKYSSVTGGTYNTAGGDFSVVSGGNLSATKDLYDVVPGGSGKNGSNNSGGCGGCGGCGD